MQLDANAVALRSEPYPVGADGGYHDHCGFTRHDAL